MKIPQTLSAVLFALLGLTGCYKTVTTVQLTQAPDIYRTASVETVEKLVSDRDKAIQTLNAQVLITATTGGGRTGKVTQYTSLKGYIFMRQPADLRVLLRVPVLGSRALDMVSNANGFTMMHASSHGDVWMQGSNTITKPSANALENLRPPVFLDSLLVRGVDKNEFVTMSESTRLIQPEKRGKPAIEEPDYDLTIAKRKAGNILQIKRVVHINRIDLLPFRQDIYDEQGRVVTSALYEQYKAFNGIQFPMLVTIQRPLDELSLKIQITSLELNAKFSDDQFQLEIPPDAVVQKMQ